MIKNSFHLFSSGGKRSDGAQQLRSIKGRQLTKDVLTLIPLTALLFCSPVIFLCDICRTQPVSSQTQYFLELSCGKWADVLERAFGVGVEFNWTSFSPLSHCTKCDFEYYWQSEEQRDGDRERVKERETVESLMLRNINNFWGVIFFSLKTTRWNIDTSRYNFFFPGSFCLRVKAE